MMDIINRIDDFTYTDWKLIESQFNPSQLRTRETIFTIGNGYLGTRGSFEEGYPNTLPATLIHGVYDDVPVVYKELVNCPDWLPLVITVFGEGDGETVGDRLRLDQGKILEYERKLDISQGLLTRSCTWCSPRGKTLKVEFERFASLADPHVLVQRCQLTPLDFDGLIEVQASINGYSENNGFNHWGEIDQGRIEHGFWLNSRTRSTRIDVSMAARMKIMGIEAVTQISTTPGYPSWNASFKAKSQQKIVIEKVITVFTSQEVEKPTSASLDKLTHQPDYQTLLLAHQKAWSKIWDQSDVMIEGDNQAAFAVRYNLYQLLIAAPRDSDRASIPAKTLSGFGYHGHIFWDTEIFISPFLILTQPALARNLLSYRYQTLDGARRKASHYGYKGAMFAWESADTGDEVTPRWSLPKDFYGEDVRIWCRDREIHINADIAYTVWYYWWVTGDDEWMRQEGAEIILDTAIFWSSRIEFNSQFQRYEIRGVIGADEYHEFVNNNGFTNRMAQWHLEKANAVYNWLCHNFPEQAVSLAKKLHLTDDLRHQWSDIIAKMWIPQQPETNLIEQFEGFFQLEPINLADYEPRKKSMQAILGVEKTNKWQVIKQPDVLMLLYLMRQSSLPYDQPTLQSNWDYYTPRTDITYGSSLAPAIHAILAADLNSYLKNIASAYRLFMEAALVDLADKRDNTQDGIHGACAGGTWQAVVFGFGGIKITENGLHAQPQLPPNWQRLKFQLCWRDRWYVFDLHQPEKDRSEIRAVIFDLDGVLTNTEELHYLAWKKMADNAGIPFDRQANEALRGVSRLASLSLIIGDRQYPAAEIQKMLEFKNNYYQQLIKQITPKNLLPGADALLEQVSQAGMKIAIASGSKNARTVIERLQIGDRLDAIADGDSVLKSKPAPDLFLHAAQLLGIPPNQCLVFEDAKVGVAAALAGHMWVVGLGPKERVGDAHIVLPSLAGVKWSEITAQLQKMVLSEVR